MTITELITALEAIKSEHGDLRVLSDNSEADYDEHKYLFVGEFVPSGNKFCGGDWAARGSPHMEDSSEAPIKAVYLSSWHEQSDYTLPKT